MLQIFGIKYDIGGGACFSGCDAAHEEVTRIHRENIERLAGFSDEELLKEKERIQQTLGMYAIHVPRAHTQWMEARAYRAAVAARYTLDGGQSLI